MGLWTRSQLLLLYSDGVGGGGGIGSLSLRWHYRAERRLSHDLRYRVPEELDELMAILVEILRG